MLAAEDQSWSKWRSVLAYLGAIEQLCNLELGRADSSTGVGVVRVKTGGKSRKQASGGRDSYTCRPLAFIQMDNLESRSINAAVGSQSLSRTQECLSSKACED